MANTDSLTVVTQAIQDLLTSHTELGLRKVYYGDQSMIPEQPAACVESVGLERELRGVGAGGLTQNTITVLIMLYHGFLQNTQVTRKECDELAESVQSVLHADVTLGGLVIHGFCATSESGTAERNQGALMRAHRITWQGTSKTGLSA